MHACVRACARARARARVCSMITRIRLGFDVAKSTKDGADAPHLAPEPNGPPADTDDSLAMLKVVAAPCKYLPRMRRPMDSALAAQRSWQCPVNSALSVAAYI